MANCGYRTSDPEFRAPQDTGGIFHRRWRGQCALNHWRRCRGCPPLARLALLSLRCSVNSANSAQEHPWATRLLENPELVAERLQGYDGAEDTPPATHINHDEHTVSASPASAAGRHLTTPERTIEHSAPTTDLPPSTANVAATRPPASVTPAARRSFVPSCEHASENSPSGPEIRHSRRRRSGRT